MTCTAADYEAAAAAISHATDIDAQMRKRIDSKAAHRALLPCDEFHDRCMKLARAISYERAQDRRAASRDVGTCNAVMVGVGGAVLGCDLSSGHSGMHCSRDQTEWTEPK